VAAPAALLAQAALRVIDALGGSSASVRTGVPPREVAVVFAMIAGLTVCLLSRGGSQLLEGAIPKIKARVPSGIPSPSRFAVAIGAAGESALAVPATTWIVTREDPAHTLRTHADYPVHEPAGQEHAHQVPDEGQRAETISG
jgi:hypothetical protein